MIGQLLCRAGFHVGITKRGDCVTCGFSAAGLHLRPYADWDKARRRKRIRGMLRW